MSIIKNTFIGKFKIGDNVHYNIKVLKALYSSRNELPEDQKNYLEKPITVILVSICEALIYDFIDRSKYFVREGVAGLSEASLDRLRKSNAWKFEKKIKLFKELNLLKTSDANIYIFLQNLANLRNRIHIQNEFNNFEADEIIAFNTQRRIEAEKMVELLMSKLSEHYPRPNHIIMSQYVNDFELPWDCHFN